MTALLPFDSLPIQRSPDLPFLDLHTLVPEVIDLYPDWNEDDLRSFIEEETRGHLKPEDLTTMRAMFQRCDRLRRMFEET